MPRDAAVPLRETLASARVKLVAAGVDPQEAALDVELFARTILGWDRAQLMMAYTEPTPETLEPRFSEWIARRMRREPAAYIIGTREFWGLEFPVSPAVLVPRPETELVVEESLRHMRSAGYQSGYRARLADIGTGSGCIAVSLAHELPDADVVATDVSPEALLVAEANATRHKVSDRIQFVNTLYLGGVEGAFDLIAANPPYIREGDLPALPPEVQYEPAAALSGGATGLRDIEGVLATAAAKLRRGGVLVMEFGFGQEEDVRRLIAAQPRLHLERIRPDLQGIPRVAVLRSTE